MLECARRLDLALNTVKRYARVSEPARVVRAPQYRPTLVDPYRDHLRAHRAEDPAVPVLQLLEEIKALGYTGSQNPLCRYITQGRIEADRPHLPPRRVTRLLLPRPDGLSDKHRSLIDELTAVYLEEWIATVRVIGLPHVHAFIRGLDFDRDAARAAVTLPFHNGDTKAANTKTKRTMRQMHERAGFALLRHRTPLDKPHAAAPPKVPQSRQLYRPLPGCHTRNPPKMGSPYGIRSGSWQFFGTV